MDNFVIIVGKATNMGSLFIKAKYLLFLVTFLLQWKNPRHHFFLLKALCCLCFIHFLTDLVVIYKIEFTPCDKFHEFYFYPLLVDQPSHRKVETKIIFVQRSKNDYITKE